MITEIIILGWLVCSVISFGASFAFFQRTWPDLASSQYYGDMVVSVLVSVFGPISFIAVFFLSGFFKEGFKFV